ADAEAERWDEDDSGLPHGAARILARARGAPRWGELRPGNLRRAISNRGRGRRVTGQLALPDIILQTRRRAAALVPSEQEERSRIHGHESDSRPEPDAATRDREAV